MNPKLDIELFYEIYLELVKSGRGERDESILCVFGPSWIF